MLDWIRENLSEPLTLAAIARQAHLSERSPVRRFCAETGMSVFDWIAADRIQAKVLLESTDYPVSHIAAMVGLGSNETLRRNFARLVGTTASAYRVTFRGQPKPALAQDRPDEDQVGHLGSPPDRVDDCRSAALQSATVGAR